MKDDTSQYEVKSNQKVMRGGKNISLRSKIEVCSQTSRGPKRRGKDQPGGICEDNRSAPERHQPCRSRQYPYPTRPGHGDRGKNRISPGMASYRRRPRDFRAAGGGTDLLCHSTERSYTVNMPAGQISFSFVKKVKPLLSSGSGDLVYEEQSEDIYSFAATGCC